MGHYESPFLVRKMLKIFGLNMDDANGRHVFRGRSETESNSCSSCYCAIAQGATLTSMLVTPRCIRMSFAVCCNLLIFIDIHSELLFK